MALHQSKHQKVLLSAVFALLGGFFACGNTPSGTDGGSGAATTGGTSASTGGTNGQATGGVGGTMPGTGGSSTTGGSGSAVGGMGGMGADSGGTVGVGGAGGAGASDTGGASGSDTGGAAGATATGGSSGSGAAAGEGGTSVGGAGAIGGVGGTGSPGFQKAAGTIPNTPQPASKTNLPQSSWQMGIVSPTMNAGKQINQPSVLNGYLVVAGNEEFWIYDVSNPASPRVLSNFSTPNKTGGEAESHTVSFARYGNTFYMVTIGGKGIDTWDVTNVMAPRHLKQLAIPGTNYGDYTEAVWGVSWQGQYIYVGATNNGIKVVDAANPSAISIVAEVPTSAFGNVSAGPLDAIGNVLVVTTPKESGGIATLDITNPTAPTRLASLSADKSYIGMFYRRWVFLINPVRAWDVLSNPRSIGGGTSPIGSLATGEAEYMSFQDDTMFLGHVRAAISGTPGASKITVANPRSMSITGRVWGRLNLGDQNDDQFTIGLGNLLAIGDDQSPYHGWMIAVSQADPDSKPPVVDTVIPKNQEMTTTKARVGLTFSDNIELATVNAASFIVRPVGGQPLPGKFGLRMGVVTFDPDQDLMPGTTYEVVLPQGGIADLVGNTLAAEFKSTFTTQ
jgi:hypothetical protein